MTTLEVVLSTIKDAVGLIGTVLIALPFFRLEGLKRRAARIGGATAGNAQTAAALNRVQEALKGLMSEPSAIDFRLTLVGLTLVAFSFAVSMSLPFVPALLAALR